MSDNQWGSHTFNAPPPAGYDSSHPPAQFAAQVSPAYQAPAQLAFRPVSQFNLNDALRFGWQRFSDNAGSWIGYQLLILAIIVALFVGSAALSIVAFSLVFDTDLFESSGVRDFILLSVISTGWMLTAPIFIVAHALGQSWLIRGALDEVDGRRLRVGDFFSRIPVPAVVGAYILVALTTLAGLAVFVVGAVVVSLFLKWTLFVAIERNVSVFTAIGRSIYLVKSHLSETFLLIFAVLLINLGGAMLLYVGLLVTVPVTIIATAYAYRIWDSETPWD